MADELDRAGTRGRPAPTVPRGRFQAAFMSESNPFK
jgi:hypothetical protein